MTKFRNSSPNTHHFLGLMNSATKPKQSQVRSMGKEQERRPGSARGPVAAPDFLVSTSIGFKV